MPTINLGLAPTSQDLDLRKQMALLRQLEAQAAQEELKNKLNDPVEAAKMEDIKRRFETRTGVGKFTPVGTEQGGRFAPNQDDTSASVPFTEANFPAMSSRQAPKVVRNITRMPPEESGSTPSDFGSLRTVRGIRPQSNTAFTDPDAAMGARGKAMLDPRVLATQEAAKGDVAVEALKAGAKANPDTPSDYTVERANRTVQSVDELATKVSPFTTGVGSLLSYLPATDARNFDAELNTLKSNIMMNELTQMREASKTGGALGQVSDTEGKLLQSALGALDPKQSPAHFSEQLQKIRESITRWQKAKHVPVSGGQSRAQRTVGRFLVDEDQP